MTTRFFLVRHGEAQGAGGPDPERRLTPSGRAAFEALARSLAPSLSLSRVVTSPYRRARETAEILAAVTGAPVEVDPSLAAGCCTGRELLEMGRTAGGGVALVGHYPELAEAVALVAGGQRAVPPGTVAAVEPGRGAGGLAWMRSP